jgi:hypothetical protein
MKKLSILQAANDGIVILELLHVSAPFLHPGIFTFSFIMVTRFFRFPVTARTATKNYQHKKCKYYFHINEISGVNIDTINEY